MGSDSVSVVYLVKSLDMGGIEELLLTLSNNFEDDQFDLTFVTLRDIGTIGREIEKSGGRVIDLDCPRGITPTNSLTIIRMLLNLFDDINPDVVHTAMWEANFYGRIAANIHRVPVIISSEQNIYVNRKLRHIIFDKLLSYFTDTIVACSESVMEFTSEQEKIPHKKFTIIYNAVDVSKFENVPDDDEVFREIGVQEDSNVAITVGALSEQKAHDTLLEAFTNLEEGDNLELVIVGDGSKRGELRERATELGIDERVHFLGERRDVPKLLKASDLFVFPSRWEGLPVALVEAMVMGLPIVASDIQPHEEVVGEDAGILVPVDDPSSLASAIDKVISNDELANGLGEQGRQRAEQIFSAKTLVSEYRTLYLNQLNNH